MSNVFAGSRTAVAVLAALVLNGCAPSTPQSHASAAQQAACRQQADQTFQVRNPDANYVADAYVSGTRDTPFSASGAISDTSSGLPARYSRDNLYSNCVNGIGPPVGAATPTPTAPAATPIAAAPAAAPTAVVPAATLATPAATLSAPPPP